MVWPQNERSRGVSQASSPKLDLNHCRSRSTSEMVEMGTSNSLIAKRVMRSNRSSGGVSRMSSSRKACRRASSSGGIGAGIMSSPVRAGATGPVASPVRIGAGTAKLSPAGVKKPPGRKAARALGANCSRSGEVEAIQVHHLVPGGHEVLDELLAVVVLRVHLRDGTQ